MAKDNNMAKTVVKSTGELLEFDISTPENCSEVYALCSEYEKAYKYIKEKIKAKVPDFVDDRGLFEYNGRQFRVSNIQRMTYDKAVIDRVIEDQDLREMMLQPNKKFIDEWLKENIETTGEVGTELRNGMIPDGKPYQVVKQEKV